jgi:hypothetical protein
MHLMASELLSKVCYQGSHSARAEGLLHWAFKFSHEHLIFHDFLIVWLMRFHGEVQVVMGLIHQQKSCKASAPCKLDSFRAFQRCMHIS